MSAGVRAADFASAPITREDHALTILGGGIAGLVAAHCASARGVSFDLHEQSSWLGGNATTFESDGHRYDSGAHRLHDRDPNVTAVLRRLLGDELHVVDAPSRIHRNGRFVDFPLTPTSLVRQLDVGMLARVARDVARMAFERRPAGNSFADQAIARYGPSIANAFLLNYSSKLWGIPCERLSAAASGRRLQGIEPRMFVPRILRRGGAKHIDGVFLYPRRGIGQLADALIESCPPGTLHASSRATKVVHDGRRIRALEVGGRREPVERLLSTLPLTTLLKLLDPQPPEAVRLCTERMRFRHVVLVALFLRRASVSRFASTYFPEPKFTFTRIHEPRCRSVAMAPEGRTSLVAEIPCGSDDRVWCEAPEQAIDGVVEQVRSLGWIDRGDVVGAAAHRMSHAYPVLEIDAEAALGEALAWLGRFENLTSLGRAATFRYVHIHDLVKEAMEFADTLDAKNEVRS